MLRRSCFLLLVLCSTEAFAGHPSLGRDCSFRTFYDYRMPEERRQFYTIQGNFEIHDVAAEAKYDRELTQQVVTCFQSRQATILPTCDFSTFQFDIKSD